jgi:hypothetical protein
LDFSLRDLSGGYGKEQRRESMMIRKWQFLGFRFSTSAQKKSFPQRSATKRGDYRGKRRGEFFLYSRGPL